MKELMVRLEYPFIRRSSGVEATATALARLTPNQIVVIGGVADKNKRGIRLGVGPNRPMRFNRKTGRPIPYYMFRHSWELAAGEIERIAAETKA